MVSKGNAPVYQAHLSRPRVVRGNVYSELTRTEKGVRTTVAFSPRLQGGISGRDKAAADEQAKEA